MQLKNRIATFCDLGRNLESFIKNYSTNELSPEQKNLLHAIQKAYAQNPWFTEENILFTLSEWVQALNSKNIELWLKKYDFKPKNQRIGIVAAGNIPMVGFHDLLCVLLAGERAQIKLSSKDWALMQYMIDFLRINSKDLHQAIEVVENLHNYDAVIATGSDNTARYFEAYFKNKPHIIRRNRTSIAVLTGEETEAQLELLCHDMLRYFGLGCRNVTKLYIPENYDLNLIFKALYGWRDIINHHKYANNYDYNRAILMMKQIPIMDNGFVLLEENDALFSPIGVVYYEKYRSQEDLNQALPLLEDKIQCLVSENFNSILKTTPLGQAQRPKLWDYADGIDTMEWIMSLK
ncbi:acyl-CoA reductase [Ornithobacterium rhinotracheale]|uniref:Acyl-CoA reductase n=1 Tax=Ornithobacterium rhinotracheale TaxID=28251 RepID=A0A410JSE1_ORNRH|nr:acyl-CoA reductase [Ornithobacterium rhinotracheale]QAR31085.1 acyl-CoA reductase [Ornithobacterium rhinotracheale]